ncbi:MAG: leucine--tRNA ligase [Aquificaceae bacterium]
MAEYDFQKIESKWQNIWRENSAFELESFDNKLYVLEMFPYPSGNIHMGHVRNYSIGDALARFMKMLGHSVLHPMGFDAFGLPAENAAIKHGVHPAKWTYQNIENMRKQLMSLGLSYDWKREVITCSPEYYHWNQWIFLRLYEHGLVYRQSAEVNWCPNDETVLANEQVIEGRCWRCSTAVERKQVPSWFIRITAYAQRLLDDLEELRGLWPERVITQQINWIGRSEGTKVRFFVEDIPIDVFTTRVDTIFGVSFIALAPEHPLAKELSIKGGSSKALDSFLEELSHLSTRERQIATEKKGLFLGVYAKHPLSNQKVPVFVANYVLYEYGTGAVMGVPAHDSRDYDFAIKYGLEIKRVVKSASGDEGLPFEEEGILVNSDVFSGLDSKSAKKAITSRLCEIGLGELQITYRLRDWNISRQRYWGTPIPIIHCPSCGIVPLRDEDLPVLLPTDISITGHGNPLESSQEFVNVKCPRCGSLARRETDTMDTFFDSSWYFLRFCDPKNTQKPFEPSLASSLMPIDFYIGGIEHAVLHLLYARFFQKFFYDLGMTPYKEPFLRLITQGMVLKRWLSVEKLLDKLGLTTEDSIDNLKLKLSSLEDPECLRNLK